jgi:hypothetical protein
MINLTIAEQKVIAALLCKASDQFGGHGCNDFDLAELMPDLEERRQLIEEYHKSNGDPEEFDREDTYENFADFCLMSYFSDLFYKNAAVNLVPAPSALHHP